MNKLLLLALLLALPALGMAIAVACAAFREKPAVDAELRELLTEQAKATLTKTAPNRPATLDPHVPQPD